MELAGYDPFLRVGGFFGPAASDALYVIVEFAVFVMRDGVGGGRFCPASQQSSRRGDVFDCRRHLDRLYGLFFVTSDLCFRNQRLHSGDAGGMDAGTDCGDGQHIRAAAFGRRIGRGRKRTGKRRR